MSYVGEKPYPIRDGGTGQSSLPTNGQLLIGNNNNFDLANLTAGSGINITNGTGSITIASTVSPPVLTPVFLARLTSTQSSVTGDGTDYTPIIFDAVDGNVGLAYDNTTGLFTAPTTQIYVFSFGIQIVNLDPTHTECSFKIESSNGANAFGFYGNPYVVNYAGYLMLSQTVIMALGAGDTTQVSLQISNGTKTIDVYGDNSGSYYTWFAGYLLAGNNGGMSTLDAVVDGSGNTVVPTGGLITLVNGTSVSSLTHSSSHITLDVKGSTQYVLQVGNASGSLNNLAAGVGLSNQVLTSQGAGSEPQWTTLGSVVVWVAVAAASQTMVAQHGYVNNNAGLTTFTLPATANFGDIIEIAGVGAGGWKIAQNAGQSIVVGSLTSTVGAGGSVSSTMATDTIRLLCTTANTTFKALSWAGNLTVV
jgi:hypothetical protein